MPLTSTLSEGKRRYRARMARESERREVLLLQDQITLLVFHKRYEEVKPLMDKLCALTFKES